MYSIEKIDPMKLSIEEMNNLYEAYNKTIHKYCQLKRFKDIEDFINLYLSNFSSSSTELYILKNPQQISGVLSFVKTFDWGGNLQYKILENL